MYLKIIFLFLFSAGIALLANDTIPDGKIKIGRIIYEGNRLTKINVISRELTVRSGDVLSLEILEDEILRSRDNIKNLSLFNVIKIDTLHNYSQQDVIDLKIGVVEQWYFWPEPVINFADRNINAWFRTCDWSKINFGFNFKFYNLFGLNHSLILSLLYGYNSIIGLEYKTPFFDKKGLLGINLIARYTISRQLGYVTAENHKIQYYTDFTHDIENTQNYGFEFVVRPRFRVRHVVGLSYNNHRISDAISVLNPHFAPDGQNATEYFTLYYRLKYDNRDYIHYPLWGEYFDVTVSRSGLGILALEKSVNVTSFTMNFRKYFRLRKRLFYAASFTGKYTVENEQPYIFNDGTGSKRTEFRGYENFAIDGSSFAILRNNAKFAVLQNREFRVRHVPEKWGKINLAIYANLFFDMGYVAQNYYQPIGIYNNKFLYSGGIGFDFVTYYDKVLRVDFTVNKQGVFGVYLHFVAPI